MFRCRRPDYYRYSTTNNRHRCSLFDDAGHLAIGRYSLHCLNTLGRLRSALYFFFSLALMTFIYCLFFSEEPAGVGGLLRSRPFGHSITKKNGTIIITTTKEYNDNNNGAKAFTSQSQAPTTMKDLISRQEDFQKLLDDMKSFANRHYLDGLIVTASRSYDVQLLASEEKLNLTRYDLELSDDYVDDEVMIGEDGSTKINSTNDDEGREESEDDSNRYSLENIIERLGFNLEHIYKHNLRLNGTVTGETLNELSNRTYGLDQQQRKRRRRQQQHQFYRTLPTLFTSNSTLIIVTAVAPNQLHLALGFVRSFEMFRRSILATNSTSLALLIYDLGLEVDHRIEVMSLQHSICTVLTFSNLLASNAVQHESSALSLSPLSLRRVSLARGQPTLGCISIVGHTGSATRRPLCSQVEQGEQVDVHTSPPPTDPCLLVGCSLLVGET